MKEYKLKINDNSYHVVIKDVTEDAVLAEVNGKKHIVHIDEIASLTTAMDTVVTGGQPPAAPAISSTAPAPPATPAAAGTGTIVTPIPGQVISISITAGERVRSGQKLLVIEAMKLENSITADMDGTVAEILVAAGDVVAQGQALVVLT